MNTLSFQRATITTHQGIPAAQEGTTGIWNQKQAVLQGAKLANYRPVSTKHNLLRGALVPHMWNQALYLQIPFFSLQTPLSVESNNQEVFKQWAESCLQQQD